MSPITCNAEYIKSFIKNLESKFPFPFRWTDKSTLGGLDAYDEWLDEQKKSVEIMRFMRKEWLKKINMSEDQVEKDIPF
jgi:hypothetical protein